MKNSFTRGLSNRFELEENSMNLNIDQWKLYTLKSREGRNKEKWTEPLRHMEDHNFTEMCTVKVPKGEDTEE